MILIDTYQWHPSMTHINELCHTCEWVALHVHGSRHFFFCVCKIESLLQSRLQLLSEKINYTTCKNKSYNVTRVHVGVATYCNTLQHTATCCNILQHTAMHCNALHHTATHCNILQHTATHCNTLQCTAPHCNTLRDCCSHNLTHIYVTWLSNCNTHCNTQCRYVGCYISRYLYVGISIHISIYLYTYLHCMLQCVLQFESYVTCV